MKSLIFFCISISITIITIIIINIAPIINGFIGSGYYSSSGENLLTSWFNTNCQDYADKYKYYKDKKYQDIPHNPVLKSQEEKEQFLNLLNEGKKKCKRKKAMVGLEYAVVNINIILGFTCTVLGLLLYLKATNNTKIIGLIGLGSGAIGCILILVYIIYSGLIFTQDIPGKTFNSLNSRYTNAQVKIDSDGGFLKWDESKKRYVCIFYDKNDDDSVYLKYTDYANKNLNYNEDNAYAYYKENFKINIMSSGGCIDDQITSSNFYENCKKYEEGTDSYYILNEKRKFYDGPSIFGKEKGECDKIYSIDLSGYNEKKNLYDHWVATIILGCIILVLNIGLAIYGFLVFKNTNISNLTTSENKKILS